MMTIAEIKAVWEHNQTCKPEDIKCVWILGCVYQITHLTKYFVRVESSKSTFGIGWEEATALLSHVPTVAIPASFLRDWIVTLIDVRDDHRPSDESHIELDHLISNMRKFLPEEQ